MISLSPDLAYSQIGKMSKHAGAFLLREVDSTEVKAEGVFGGAIILLLDLICIQVVAHLLPWWRSHEHPQNDDKGRSMRL
mmetsp:Transcript_53771/g.88632  ORF Transcript_53771/g.88632 Transcript_53771/m.88632 type:complete len:80 (+) Transcript_53771:1167-1406(+)